MLTFALLAVSVNTSALTQKEYEDAKANKQKWPITQVYLNGVGVGATITSDAAILKKQPRLFCKPKEVELKPNSYTKLIDAFIAKNKVPDVPIENILVMALVTAFPCS